MREAAAYSYGAVLDRVRQLPRSSIPGTGTRRDAAGDPAPIMRSIHTVFAAVCALAFLSLALAMSVRHARAFGAGAAEGVPRRREDRAEGAFAAVGGERDATRQPQDSGWHVRVRAVRKAEDPLDRHEKPFEQLIVGDGVRVWVHDRGDLNPR